MEFNVRLEPQQTFKVTTNLQGVAVPAKFSDLEDFDPTGLSDNYIIMYNANTQKYTMVNPDELLIKAVTEPTSPGLPDEFLDKLDTELDDRIDLDAGSF